MDDLVQFAVAVWSALIFGAVIGAERQYRNHPAGLRTNILVSVGAALFVTLSRLMDDTQSPTRIASYIVSGIGFLGGGVILKEGANVKGINTAATLWCAAAVGTLCGAGFPGHAAFGSLTVLAVNLALRPAARTIDGLRKARPNPETRYRIKVECVETQEAVIRTVILRHVNSDNKMTTEGISTRDEVEEDGLCMVSADIVAVEPRERAIQDLMTRINIEPGVKSLSWRKLEEEQGD